MKKFTLTIILPMLAGFIILLASNSTAGKPAYTSLKNCKKCHIPQFKSWKETKMSKAFDLLKPGERSEAKKKAKLDPNKDYTKDKTCLKCHVTGYGEPGGFTSIEKTPGLAGVTCEACHGPGSEYTKPDMMSFKNKNFKLTDVKAAGLIYPPTKEVCIKCHNSESPFVNKGYKFDFKTRKDKGTHKHFPMKYKHD